MNEFLSGKTMAFTVFVRHGCHLCDDLLDELRSMEGLASFSLTTIDIDRDPELQTRYNADVPVLMFEGREVCKHFLNPAAVKEVFSHV